MSQRFLECLPGDVVPLPDRGRLPASVHILDEDSIEAVNAALATGRPLLVRGDPGTGKSQLARAAAEKLGRAFVPHAVDGRTETRDLLWSVDAVSRLATAQIVGALGITADEALKKRLDVAAFVRPGPLWWAFDWIGAEKQAKRSGATAPDPPPDWSVERGAVVLVDEIDKADPSVPNGLLDALGHGCFDVDGYGPVVMDRARPPLVVITTNEERTLPDAFLRRCLVLHLALPEDRRRLLDLLVNCGRAHFPDCDPTVLQRAAELLAETRAKLGTEDLVRPGLAEYLDLITAVTRQRETAEKQLKLLATIAKFALEKHPQEGAR